MRERNQALQLSIGVFTEKLSPYWYWYHFIHITMPMIRNLCKEYDLNSLNSKTPSPNPDRVSCIILWRRWFRLFDERVRALGGSAAAWNPKVRVMLELRAEAAKGRLQAAKER